MDERAEATRCQANDIGSLPPLRMRAQLTSGSPVSTIIFFLDDIGSIAEKPSLECVLSCRGRAPMGELRGVQTHKRKSMRRVTA